MKRKRTTINIKTPKREIEEFEINKGDKNREGLFATLFNLAVEYDLRKINKEGKQ